MDSVAFAVMSTASDLGLKIPQYLSVAGYDNSRICDLPQLSLTCVDQSAHLLGHRAAEILLERIDGRVDEAHLVKPPSLCVRRSSDLRKIRSRLGSDPSLQVLFDD
jgi:DNA-binding LacI/PurR family transcriptional regulator